jgi:hypothetical protein
VSKHSYRTKQRVSALGEVWTPEWVVKKMCDLIPANCWSDPTHAFLEPTCGNGNILVEIVERRLASGLDVFQTANNIWGMDIMSDNIFEAHSRVFAIFKAHLAKHSLTLRRNDLIKLIAIVENNIFLVKDSLTEIGDNFANRRFFDRDPTCRDFVLTKAERIDKATDINERIKLDADTNAFACLLLKRAHSK